MLRSAGKRNFIKNKSIPKSDNLPGEHGSMNNVYLYQRAVLLLLIAMLLPFSVDAQNLQGKKIAIAVFIQDDSPARYGKIAQTRLEDILDEQGVIVLDQEKVDELKDVWGNLEDPGYFITAEDFVENAGKHELDAILRVYINSEAIAGIANYYTATASVDLRLVDSTAQVSSAISVPMGSPGYPPSDGLTKLSAVKNALRRAADDSLQQIGMAVFDPTEPRTVTLELEGPVAVKGNPALSRSPQNDKNLWRFAELEGKTWRKESITLTAQAPGGNMAALAGYIKDTKTSGKRRYGSRVHLVDTRLGKEITVFEVSPVGKKTRAEKKGPKKILDLFFIDNWRYLAAINGSKLFLWDTERGRELAQVVLPKGAKRARLNLVALESGYQLTADTDKSGLLAYNFKLKN